MSFKVIFGEQQVASGRGEPWEESESYATRAKAEKALVAHLRENVYQRMESEWIDPTQAESYDECFDADGELKENLTLQQLETLVEEFNDLGEDPFEAYWEIREEK